MQHEEPSRGIQVLAAGATYALVAVAGFCTLSLGTLGYFFRQFGIMTKCTNEYGCTETLCSPCVPPFAWLTVGAGIQLLLLASLVSFILRFWSRQGRRLVAGTAAAILIASAVTVVVTTNAADRSYARAGAVGFVLP